MNLKEFCEQRKIKASVEYVDNNPAMDPSESRSMNHYRVTLRFEKRRMTVPFSTGMAWTREPNAVDVLSCLVSDTTSYDSAASFEDWCADLGLDVDSRRAERTWKAIEKQARKVKTFLGDAWDDAVDSASRE